MRGVVFSVYLYAASICLLLIDNVCCHGTLLKPTQRSSMWRYGYDVPANYDDNALNCGFKLLGSNDNCICGDPMGQTVTPNNGGKYDTGTLAAHYQAGQTIDVQVELTANHKGYFEFRLCPRSTPKMLVTQECFNQHLLSLSGMSQTRYHPGTRRGVHSIQLQLPNGVTCSHCVLQWKYKAGNSFGCENGMCCVGCGPQETFANCADVEIGGNIGTTTHTPTTKTTQKRATPTPTKTSKSCTCQGMGMWRVKLDTWCDMICKAGNCPSIACTCSCDSPQMKPVCKAAGAFVGMAAMDTWCRSNCAQNNCPSTFCMCN